VQDLGTLVVFVGIQQRVGWMITYNRSGHGGLALSPPETWTVLGTVQKPADRPCVPALAKYGTILSACS